MYNRDIKERYIIEKVEDAISQKDILRRLFENTEEFETNNGKDIYDFSAFEIEDMYKTMNISSYDRIRNIHSSLSLYTQWCLKERLVKDNLNHFYEIDKDQLLNYLNVAMFKRRILSRDFLLAAISKLPNPSDGFMVLGLFEGIKGIQYADFENINLKQIHGNELHLRDGRVMIISDQLKDLAIRSAEEYNYYSTSGSQVKTVTLVGDADQILKDYPNVKGGNFGNRFFQRLKRIFRFLDMEWMRATQLSQSGQIEFIKMRSKELGISPMEYMDKYKDEIAKQFHLGLFVPTNFYSVFKEYLE